MIPGGYPGAFRDLLGVTTEQFFPLAEGETVTLDDGSTASVWTEKTRAVTAHVESTFATGTLTTHPAITRHEFGSGIARYLATQLDAQALREFLRTASVDAGVDLRLDRIDRVDVVIRRSDDRDYLFVINHGSCDVSIPTAGHELVCGTTVESTLCVPAGAVRVIREDTAP